MGKRGRACCLAGSGRPGTGDRGRERERATTGRPQSEQKQRDGQPGFGKEACLVSPHSTLPGSVPNLSAADPRYPHTFLAVRCPSRASPIAPHITFTRFPTSSSRPTISTVSRCLSSLREAVMLTASAFIRGNGQRKPVGGSMVESAYFLLPASFFVVPQPWPR